MHRGVVLFVLLGLSALALAGGETDNENALDISQETDIEIVGLGENCDDLRSVCDKKSHLACADNGICVCDPNKGYHLQPKGSKCEKFKKLGQDGHDIIYENYDWHDNEFSLEDSEEESSQETRDYLDDFDKWQMDENETEWKLSEKSNAQTQLKELNNEEKPEVNEKPDVKDEQEQANEPKNEESPQSDQKDGENSIESESSQEDSKGESSSSEEDKTEDSKVIGDIDLDLDQEGEEAWEKDSEEVDPDWQLPEEEIKIQPRGEDITCTLNVNCTESSFGKLSRCNMVTGSCECFDVEETGREINLIEGKCLTNKEINEPCTTHAECDNGIEGDAWCHTDLETNTNYCQCKPFHLWDGELRECLKFALEVGSPCKRDGQCNSNDALGPHARCSEVTETCECSNSLAEEIRNIIYFDGKCQPERNLGESCRTDQECEATWGQYGICSSETSKCTCQEGRPCFKTLKYSIERPQMSSFTFVVLGVVGAVILIGGLFCLVMKKSDANYSFIEHNNEV